MEKGLARLEALGKIPPAYPGIRPKDSATLIILDRSGAVPKVLLGRRHDAHAFMPGKFVFPGGRLERADSRMPSVSELNEQALAKLTIGTTGSRARALALTALRETFEETGLMLGARSAGLPDHAPGTVWSAFAAAGVSPDLARLRFVARAITPPGLPRRFDTRFFAVDAEAIAHRVDGVVGPEAELVELVWVPIAETGGLGLHAITAAILDELEVRTAAGMGHDLPVPFYRMKNRRFVRELL